MSWTARLNYLAVIAERDRLNNYAMDLLWLAVKNRYEDLPQPSMVAAGKAFRDQRTSREILADTRRKFEERAKRRRQKNEVREVHGTIYPSGEADP